MIRAFLLGWSLAWIAAVAALVLVSLESGAGQRRMTPAERAAWSRRWREIEDAQR